MLRRRAAGAAADVRESEKPALLPATYTTMAISVDSLVAMLFLLPLATACSTDSDCSLNGLCKNGACACDAEWIGDRCDLLNLLPTIPGHGYRPVNGSSWGGSLIRGADGQIHMFAAHMTEHCGLLSWETNSEVVHAVAPSPLGPFTVPAEQPTVIHRFAHNPTVHQNTQGRYLLYHIGCGATPTGPCAACRHCTNGTTPAAPDRAGFVAASGENCNGPHWTGLRSSASLNGPWVDEGEVTLSLPEGAGKANTWITNPCVSPAGLGADFGPSAADANTTYLLYRQSGTSWPNAAPGTRERLGWAVGTNCPTSINCTFEDVTPRQPILNVSKNDDSAFITRNCLIKTRNCVLR